MNGSDQSLRSKANDTPEYLPKPIAGRRDEALPILEEYADDLRRIIAKLRGRLH